MDKNLQKKIKQAKAAGYDEEEIQQYLTMKGMSGGGEGSSEPQWSDLPGNILPSAGKNIQALVQPFLHPVKTAENLAGLATGAVSKLMPGEATNPRAQQGEQIFDNVTNFYKDRYGGASNIKKTAIEDPTGVLLDASALLSGGGAALKGAGALTKAGGLTKAGSVLEALDPIAAAGKVLSPVGKAVDKVPGEILNRYLTPDNRSARLAEVEQTLTKGSPRLGSKVAAEGKIPTTPGKLVKMAQKNIDELGPEIQKTIDANKKMGIDVDKAIEPLEALKEQFKNSFEGEELIQQIDNIQYKILGKADEAGQVSVADLYNLKKNQDKITGKFYGAKKPLNEIAPTTAVKMAASDKLRDILNELVPGLKDLNKKYGLWNQAKKAAVPQAEKMFNLKPTTADLFFGGGGFTVGGIPGALGGLALRRLLTLPMTGMSVARGAQEFLGGVKGISGPASGAAKTNYLFDRGQQDQIVN
jgi:hypothetical protein